MPEFISKGDALAIARYSRDVVDGIENLPTVEIPEWISVEDRLPEPEREVLVSCKTRPNGYEYRCLAFFVPERWFREQSDYNWDYESCNEYCEEADDYYVNEGWYERIHNWDDYSAVCIGDFVTHWMPLPPSPEEGNNG